MANMKGMAIRGALRYVKKSHHPGGIPAILAALPDSVAPIFERKILSSSWYEYEAYGALLEVIDGQLGSGDYREMRSLGRFAAEADAGAIFRMVVAVASVERVLGFLPFFWSRTCDTGILEVETVGDKGAICRLRDFPDVHPAHCSLLGHWTEGMGLAGGAKSTQVEKVLCVHRGDSCCEYHGSWEKSSSLPPA